MAVNLLSLPIEIIQLIGNSQDDQDLDCVSLKTLRLVCSQFNCAFEAQVLSTLVIVVIFNTLWQSQDMLLMFATQNEKTSRAVQHARTLKIKYLSPIMTIDPESFPISEPESETQDLFPGPPSLIHRLASALFSLKGCLEPECIKLKSEEISAIGEELVKEHLELAISSMKNLTSVKWAIQNYDPSWTEAVVIRGIARLPQLEYLQLVVNCNTLLKGSFEHIQLGRLSRLKKISLSSHHVNHPRDVIKGLAGLIAKSPQLAHLEVSLGYSPIMLPEIPTLHDVLRKVPEDHPLQLTHLALNRTGICLDSTTLPHLRSLVSLDLRNLPPPSNLIHDADLPSETLERTCSTSDICAILKQEGIYLKHLLVSDVGVFDYLCSYSGLETLDLCFITFNTAEESNSLARTFYKSVLPQLVHSLEVLKIQPKREGRWCFDPEDDFQTVVFPQCHKLRSLTVALNTLSTIYIPSLKTYGHEWKDNLDDTISSLINLSLKHLPTLSEICIVIPKLGFESDFVILNNSSYDKTVMELITRSVTEFSLDDGIGQLEVVPDIWVDRKKLYRYKTLEYGERRRYVLRHQKLLDPYEYIEDKTAVMGTVLAPTWY